MRRYFRAGDEVFVRGPQQILATLDADGSMDGLPFMSEMLPYCGRRFRVSRRVEKTCVEPHAAQRRFPENDVVMLEEIRCSGDGHDGCKRGCMMFWKAAWIQHARDVAVPLAVPPEDMDALASRLKAKKDATNYHCQSTQLGDATEAIPRYAGIEGSRIYKFRMIGIAIREIWYGNRSLVEVIRLAVHWIRLEFRRRKIGMGVLELTGPNKRTPTETLGLEPGDRVRIKSLPKIVATLDERSKNRGLTVSVAMMQNCGREYEVGHRVDRMIIERTGQMREIQNTVSLRGLECLCSYQMGGCPRGDLQYWREIWLERATGDQ